MFGKAVTFEEFGTIEGVKHPKLLPDGRVAFLHPLMYTVALCVGPLEDGCYDDRWCYHDETSAFVALMLWDGTGEPYGWHRHPTSGRRRPDGDPAKEYVSR